MSTGAQTPSSGPSRRRIVLARVLVAAAAVLAVVAALAGYVRYQALDEDTFHDTAAELIADETVRNQIAAAVVDSLYANVDVSAELEDALPENLQALAAPIAGLTRQFADRFAERILARPRVQELWVRSLSTTQEQLIKLLDGDTTVVQETDGAVVLDLQPLVVQLGDEIAIVGRLAQTLPPDSGRIAIMQADDLSLAQDLTHALDVVGLWFWLLPVALFATAVAIVPGRRRVELRAVALSAIAVGLLILLLRGLAGRYFVNHLVEFDTVRPAARNAWAILTALLADGGRTLVALGLLLLLGVWLAGPTRSGTAGRRIAAPFLARPLLAYGIFAAFVLLVLWWGPTEQTRRPLQMLVAVVVLGVGFEALRRFTVQDMPDAAAASPGAGIRLPWRKSAR